jgi:hypothetical protein
MAHVRRAWVVVKKHPIRAALAITGVVGALVLVGALHVSPVPPMPSFQFLAGQAPMLTVRDRGRDLEKHAQDLYSFQADPRSVYEAARAELSSLGYSVVKPLPDATYAYPTCLFSLRTSDPEGYIHVRIMGDVKLAVFSTPPNSQYATPDRSNQKIQAGWVTVEITQNHRRSWLSEWVRWVTKGLRSKLGPLRAK